MFPVFASTHNAIISVSVYIALPLFLLFNYFLRKEFLGCYLCFANLLSKFPCHTYFYYNFSWIWCSHFLLICWGFNSMKTMPQSWVFFFLFVFLFPVDYVCCLFVFVHLRNIYAGQTRCQIYLTVRSVDSFCQGP